jgi:hypothetical protein
LRSRQGYATKNPKGQDQNPLLHTRTSKSSQVQKLEVLGMHPRAHVRRRCLAGSQIVAPFSENRVHEVLLIFGDWPESRANRREPN